MAQQRYQVIERIDAGGMAEVFKANSTSLQGFQKLVAIKRVLPSLTKNERFVRMFLDEAKVSLHLNHTNIVQVFDLGIADGTYFIVMEFVDGTNLKKIIQTLGERRQRLPIEEGVFIALEVCKGLSHAHNKRDMEDNHLSIVHRDISPPNVLISREGEVKITDFGLAKAKSQAEITDPGVVKGKFGYLSPEAAQGEEVDPRTDVFAVGILLWEMLAGRRLFLGESDLDTLKLVRDAKIPSLNQYGRKIPATLERILMRSLKRDPEERYQTTEQMGRELASFLFEHGAVCTSFDIAARVNEVLTKEPKKKRAADVAAGQQVQQELNKLTSLEQMGGDLDLMLAKTYSAMEGSSADSADYDGDGEDPRDWLDLGFGEDDDDFSGEAALSPDTPPPGEADQGEEGWAEGGLADVARATMSMPAVQGPHDAATVQMERAPNFNEDIKRRAAQLQAAEDAKRRGEEARAAERGRGGGPPQRPSPPAKPAPPPGRGGAGQASGPQTPSPQAHLSRPDGPQHAVPTGPDTAAPVPQPDPGNVAADQPASGGNGLLYLVALIILAAAAGGAYYLVSSGMLG